MDCSIPDFPVLHHLPEFAQTHVHWVSDAIQPSHPLSSPSPPAFNLPNYQSLIQWVDTSHQMATVLELQLQHRSFQWIFLEDWLVWSPCSSRDSRESSPTPQQGCSRTCSVILCLAYHQWGHGTSTCVLFTGEEKPSIAPMTYTCSAHICLECCLF